MSTLIRTVWRYQRSKQKPYIEGQTRQWKKNKQWSTKYYTETKNWATRTILISERKLYCSGRVSISWWLSWSDQFINYALTQHLYVYKRHRSHFALSLNEQSNAMFLMLGRFSIATVWLSCFQFNRQLISYLIIVECPFKSLEEIPVFVSTILRQRCIFLLCLISECLKAFPGCK